MTSFSNVGCTSSGGLSAAANNTVSTIDELKTAASENLNSAIGVANTLNNYSFDEARFSPDYDGSGLLGDHSLAEKPGYDELMFSNPDDPGDRGGVSITTTDINTYLPPLDTTLIDKMVDRLCDILDNGFDGLPVVYECLQWSKARDEVYQTTMQAKMDAALSFSMRGWSSPQGPEIAVYSQVIRDEDIQLAEASRDIAFKVYDTAIGVFLDALNAVTEYFAVWAKLYDAWVDAQTKLNEYEAIKERLELSRLKEKIRIFQIQSDNERSRIDSLARAYGINTSVYQTEVGLGSHTDRRNQAEFGLETVRRDLGALENQQNNRANAARIRADTQQNLTNLRQQLSMYGQATSAQLQSLQFSSAIRSQVGSTNNKGCRTSYSYSETKKL